MPRLTPQERDTLLPELAATGWQGVAGRDAIRKVWRFADFSAAWGFMARAALAAEAMNHHPEWRNVYNIVDVTLSTHDAEGLTMLDIDLARRVDRLGQGGTVVAQHDAPILSTCQQRAADRTSG